MAVNTRKKTINGRTFRILLCAALYIALALFTGSLFLLSANYQKVYDSPTVRGGKADFTGIEISSRSVPCTLTGEWEFFYNEWIVTDSYDGQADGMIKLPGLWTWRDFGNGKLPKTGYASYRLVLENVQPDIDITVFRHNADVAYRVFLNGKLNVRSGTVSKDIDETRVSGRYDESIPFHTDGSPIEVVIELSACTNGGFNVSPWLNYDWSGSNTYGARLRSFTFIALGISTAAVAVSILTFLFFKYKQDITVPALMLALFAHFLCSKDIMYVFALPFTFIRLFAFFSAAATFVIFILHMRRNGVSYKKTTLLITAISGAVFTVLLFVLYGTPYAPIAALGLILTPSLHLIPVSGGNLTNAQRVLYGVFLTLILTIFVAELCDGLGLLVFGIEFYFSIELMLIIACFTVLWLWKIATASRTAVRVSELECELFSAKTQALKAQIKPHFVFNSLTAIQAQYRDGLHEGDRAIEQFAKHLRLITDSNGEDVIAFDDEVRNVLNYFELENLRADGKLNLLLDLDYTDFSVPVLSLQPLVENAVKHGNLRSIQDGYISLSSERTERSIIVTVADNGQGFDPDQVQTGVGLENARKRFELIGAQMTIHSAPNQGTHVTIELPL
ncbi:MAG: histidine kinase [Clostridia bacterium]|nr:histidine kinase [Clostridia bacterium]